MKKKHAFGLSRAFSLNLSALVNPGFPTAIAPKRSGQAPKRGAGFAATGRCSAARALAGHVRRPNHFGPFAHVAPPPIFMQVAGVQTWWGVHVKVHGPIVGGLGEPQGEGCTAASAREVTSVTPFRQKHVPAQRDPPRPAPTAPCPAPCQQSVRREGPRERPHTLRLRLRLLHLRSRLALLRLLHAGSVI